MTVVSTFSSSKNVKPVYRSSANEGVRDYVLSLIAHGYAIVKLNAFAQQSVWAALDEISHVPESVRAGFTFPDRTDGFLAKGGEHAKYSENIDLCDRFCYWHKHRSLHLENPFVGTLAYQSIVASEAELALLAKNIISGLWDFFQSDDQVQLRDSSYIQLCIYQNDYQSDDRVYLQDKHEDGHLITLIKPTRDGLVIFVNNEEVPVHLADDEIIVITGSLLTLLSDGQIPTMYHAVRNPKIRLSRKSLVYFVIPDLHRSYNTLLGKSPINIADFADESHRAFGNTALI